MSKGTMNVISIVGRLGDDPEVFDARRSDSVVCNMSVATTDGWGDNQQTNWHKVICFNKTAEFAEDYLKKGDLVAVQGSMRYRKWEDRDGNNRIAAEIVANQVTSLTSKDDRERRDRRSDGDDRGRDRDRDRGRDRDDDRDRGRGRSRDRDDRWSSRDNDRGRDRDRGRDGPNDEIPF